MSDPMAENALKHTAPAEIDASKLQSTLTEDFAQVPLPNSAEVWSLSTATDHMITVQWSRETGWETPQLKPYGPLVISPIASCLHYATQCFEGLKCYRGSDGKLRLFRPHLNAARLFTSAKRIALPGFDPTQVVELIIALLRVDGSRKYDSF
jgi:branched-chain amino acid aminotransferase